MVVIKNKKVGSHAADMQLSCGCVHVELVESAIDASIICVGDKRMCKKHGEQKIITPIVGIYWLDFDDNK